MRILVPLIYPMRTLLLTVFLMPFAVMAQDKAKSLSIKGDLKNFKTEPEWVYLYHKVGGAFVTDSCKIAEGNYSFSVQLDEPDLLRLRVKYPVLKDAAKAKQAVPIGSGSMAQNRDYFVFYAGPGKIKISSVDSFSNGTVKGSKNHDAYLRLQAGLKPFEDQMKGLYQDYAKANAAKDVATRDRVEAKIDSLDEAMKESVLGPFAKTESSSPVAFYALQQYAGYDINPGKVEPLYEGLSETIRTYPSAVAFKDRLETAKKTGVGRIAPDFTQNDTLDQPVQLSSLRGKYVLVDFWASWCGPCRQENPNVVKVFNQYKDKNFHVLGVSLDREGQKDKWMKAIHDDQLTWTHVSDLKFWNNAVAKQYGIQAIPQNLLVDPQGKIVAKNLRGEALAKKMQELLGN
ncbi:MAG: hypothetical protein RLZZ466_673 [Bacteroidota bacterium]